MNTYFISMVGLSLAIFGLMTYLYMKESGRLRAESDRLDEELAAVNLSIKRHQQSIQEAQDRIRKKIGYRANSPLFPLA